MKFRNIFFGFLRTWLLIVIFCSSALSAGTDMILILRDYQYTAADFPPYFLVEDPLNTGNFIKVLEEQNTFQFKTYNLSLEADLESYKAEVKPILIEWSEKTGLIGKNAKLSKRFSGLMESYVNEDFRGLDQGEIHIATYKGKISAISYTKDAIVGENPEINLLVANPSGLVENQTTLPKGGGSSLLDYMVRRYEEAGVEKIQLSSVNDEYYLDRGWQIAPKPEGACGGDG
ncbi:hypothetical protein MS2017_1536 [Bathymodiolus thermophilus thioautotrophic gill symbiont]|uniref:N-acetyltransferase domain-containing protein n=1 Tax=Bathymodiolus thermophilus thioautotrophic gill symbiont TaxID=2360 RepID=A0A3G3IN60_9GAMM|nr:hypothetical protein [Bathymodiolus thermophilus thioautotrophic gill symbiont]AYQ57221.1 hypothetical protein MS2017_1536 [Bathymodiolus thermophilus thioautotrophic gill symbiont]CAB5505604.1 hypothetical protein THERMOS_2157 [Bathymodiolus thermophilus thioautotrophic gill symbiont]